MFDLYHNGREPVLNAALTNIGDVVNKCAAEGHVVGSIFMRRRMRRLLEWMKTKPYKQLTEYKTMPKLRAQ